MKTIDKMILAATCVAMLAAGGCTAVKETEVEKEEEITEQEMTGGWQKAEDGTITDELRELFEKAIEGLSGVGYTPVELLETQVVAGTNYKFLADAITIVPGAETRQVIITIYQDLDGNAEILEIEDFEEDVQIANPFVTVDTMEEAEHAAGFAFTVPETIDGYTETEITYTDFNMIQAVYYNNDDRMIIRKMKGSDDISGDYNVYETETEIIVNENHITAKADSDGIHTIIWTDGEYAYAIVSDRGLSQQMAESLISAVK